MNNKIYLALVIVRILLVFIPQNGYIHPDEFFQTTEVLAHRILDLDGNLPWEFNVTFPIRSMGVASLTVGLSYHCLKAINYFVEFFFNESIITTYSLIVVPRLVICVMSFLIDFSLYKICITNNEKFRPRLCLIATSYVTLTFGSRTFTNSFELILFSVLLYYVSDSIIFSNIIIKQREYLNKRYNNAESASERAKFHKLRLFLAHDGFRNCLQIATVSVAGFFNRPTFLAFAVAPLFFWFYRGIGFKSVSQFNFIYRIFIFILASLPSLICFVVYDSFFYGYISWGEIGMLDISINSFVFPPWNFIRYNIDSGNTAQHGIHARGMHVLVNIPLLFNIVGVLHHLTLINYGVKLFRRKFHLLPTIRSIRGLMLLSILIPVAMLSYIPHQEPRFLIPIMLPLIYLYAHDVYTEPSNTLMKSERPSGIDTQQLNLNASKRRKHKHILLKIWLALNFLSLLFYAFIHQGGVIPLAQYISSQMMKAPNNNHFVVTSHTYMVPRSLFLLPRPDKVFYKGKTAFQYNNRLVLKEEGSAKSIHRILSDLTHVMQIKQTTNVKRRNYFVLPSSKHRDFEEIAERMNITISKVITFWPHVTVEALPDPGELLHFLINDNLKSINFAHLKRILSDLLTGLSLNLYELKILCVRNK